LSEWLAFSALACIKTGTHTTLSNSLTLMAGTVTFAMPNPTVSAPTFATPNLTTAAGVATNTVAFATPNPPAAAVAAIAIPSEAKIVSIPQSLPELVDVTVDISDSALRRNLIQNVLHPELTNEIKSSMTWRFRWNKMASCAMGMSELFVMANVVACFSAGYFGYSWISFVAGCLAVVSTAVKKFSFFSSRNSRSKTMQVNSLLSHVGIQHGLPDLVSPGDLEDQLVSSAGTSAQLAPERARQQAAATVANDVSSASIELVPPALANRLQSALANRR